MRQWVEIKIYADFARDSGYVKVWQDGILVSHARVNGGNGYLAQAHFGLYAPHSLSRGMVYNDDLIIREVDSET